MLTLPQLTAALASLDNGSTAFLDNAGQLTPTVSAVPVTPADKIQRFLLVYITSHVNFDWSNMDLRTVIPEWFEQLQDAVQSQTPIHRAFFRNNRLTEDSIEDLIVHWSESNHTNYFDFGGGSNSRLPPDAELPWTYIASQPNRTILFNCRRGIAYLSSESKHVLFNDCALIPADSTLALETFSNTVADHNGWLFNMAGNCQPPGGQGLYYIQSLQWAGCRVIHNGASSPFTDIDAPPLE